MIRKRLPRATTRWSGNWFSEETVLKTKRIDHDPSVALPLTTLTLPVTGSVTALATTALPLPVNTNFEVTNAKRGILNQDLLILHR